MRLTRFTDIGLRALTYLGGHADRAVPTGEMSVRLRVSRDHLLKSLRRLDQMGLVVGTRGRGGGYKLVDGLAARHPLGQVVRALEPSLTLAECFGPESHCPLTGDCKLASALSEAQRAFFGALDSYTLADLIEADGPKFVQLEDRGDVA